MTAHRTQQLERLIRRLRYAMFSRDDAYAERCGRAIVLAKHRCRHVWAHRAQRAAEIRLERQG